MIDLLHMALGAGLFFVSCTAIFVVGFVIDARVQARRATRTGARSDGRRNKGLERIPI